jgi:hypothetical protein
MADVGRQRNRSFGESKRRSGHTLQHLGRIAGGGIVCFSSGDLRYADDVAEFDVTRI